MSHSIWSDEPETLEPWRSEVEQAFPGLTVTCVACPAQIEGVLDGRHVYARARHGRWRVEVEGFVIASGDTEPGPYELAALAVKACQEASG